MKPSDGGDLRGLAYIGTLVAEMVVPVLIGIWIDRKGDCSPWATLGGSVIGVGCVLAHSVLLNRR